MTQSSLKISLEIERDLDAIIGHRLRTARLRAGITLSDLQTLSGVGERELQDLGDGMQIGVGRMVLLCRLMHIDPKKLLRQLPALHWS